MSYFAVGPTDLITQSNGGEAALNFVDIPFRVEEP